MKLDKPTRERLYKAQGKSIAITWPEEEIPKKGKRYPVYSEQGEKVFSVEVEGSKRVRDGSVKAFAKINDDPVRIMPGLSGTRNELGDYEDEPERVPACYEALLASEGALKTTLLGAEQRQEEKAQRKEVRVAQPRSARAERAVRRHQRALERRLGEMA